jgi:sec-independent protein translocase protein TatC
MTEQEPSDTTKLVRHLLELRRRLLLASIFVLLTFAILLYFANDLFGLVAAPLLRALPENHFLVATSVTSTFVAPIKLTFFIALFAAMPFLLYQVWAFVAPGLYQHERRLAWPLLFLSTALFYTGMAFAFFAVFPLMFQFFINTAPTSVLVLPDIDSYISFIAKLLFSFGITFEVPIITFLAIRTGLVSIENLEARRPYMIVLAFIIGMLLTPPDVLSQILLAIPLYLLFESGILLAKMLPGSARPTAC